MSAKGVIIDKVGQRSGLLTVVRLHKTGSSQGTLWECVCECGGGKIISSRGIAKGTPKSCGCLKPKGGGAFIDRTGQRYGKLTVVRINHDNQGRRTRWDCVCDCGNEKTVKSTNLISGNTKSCGCGEEANRITHGDSKSKLYHRWEKMIERTCNPRKNNYHNYGGRGIGVCDRWKSYENFKEDMGPTFREELWLERVNNEQGYSPDNCIWVSPSVNLLNKRNSKRIEFDGKKLTLMEWSKLTGISVQTLGKRFQSGRWSTAQALGFRMPPSR